MPRYIVTLTDVEKKELTALVHKGGKGYRIKHAQILLKLDKGAENEEWTYDRIKEAYGASHSTIAGVAKRFVIESMEAALGRKEQKNRCRKVTGDEVYQRPYDPLNPVVCIDETNKQLIQETCIPCEPGYSKKVDSEYIRNGVADIFMICEPLAGKRETVVTQSRTALNFAHVLKYTSDTLYPRAEK